MNCRLFVCVMLGMLGPPRGWASTALVPSEFGTVQAGVNSGRDTVIISGGNYPETVTISTPVVLTRDYSSLILAAPRILRLIGNFSGDLTLEGLHFVGGVWVRCGNFVAADCRADSGLDIGYGRASVTGCTVTGNLKTNQHDAHVLLNTILQGTLSGADDSESEYASNVIEGPSPVGIIVGNDAYVTDNWVRNCTIGIQSCGYNGTVTGNLVEDCAGDGITTGPCGAMGREFDGNTVRRCGGRGIAVALDDGLVVNNTVDSTGGSGVEFFGQGLGYFLENNTVEHAGGDGIKVAGGIVFVRGNRIWNCRGDGLMLGFTYHLDHNVSGGNSGRGIVVQPLDNSVIRSNTVYDNLGAGFDLTADYATPDTLTNNIALGNAIGLHYEGVPGLLMGCNDWFANIHGETEGIPPDASDLSVNPQFCNLAAGIVSLAESSPLLDPNGCGLVGALDSACLAPAGVEVKGAVGLARLSVFPMPSRGGLTFVWRALPTASRLDLYDVQGALRFSSDLVPRQGTLQLGPTDTRARTLEPGVYFACVRGHAELGSARVIVTH